MDSKNTLIFDEQQQHIISHAVTLAENRTSGEIRVCVERTADEDPIARAMHYFKELGMDQTALQNGVLIYIAVQDKQFAIIGDKGINQKVPLDFWEETKNCMLEHFKKQELIQGIVAGVQMAGEQLKHYFPVAENDINELPNDVAQF